MSWPAYRLFAGTVHRQDIEGGRWIPLPPEEANALLARLSAAQPAVRDAAGFKVGDVVQLKSGGHPMTVIGREGGCGADYHLVWLPDVVPADTVRIDGDLPCFFVPGACLRPYSERADELPF